MEEGIRFERMVGRPTSVFKTDGLNHSPNPPKYGRRESNPQIADFKSDASAVPPLPHKYPDRDSNPDKVNQNHLCYRYTIGVKKVGPRTLAISCSPLGLGLITPRYVKESVPSFISGLYRFRLIRTHSGHPRDLGLTSKPVVLLARLCVLTASSRKPVQPLHTVRFIDFALCTLHAYLWTRTRFRGNEPHGLVI